MGSMEVCHGLECGLCGLRARMQIEMQTQKGAYTDTDTDTDTGSGGHVIARRGEARRRTWDRGESRRLAVSVALNPQELRRATVRPVDGNSKAA